MMTTFTLAVSKKNLQYLREITKAGAKSHLRQFAELPKEEQNKLLFETFVKQFVRVCSTKEDLQEFSFDRKGSVVKVRKALILRTDKPTTLLSVVLTIIPKKLDGNTIHYEIVVHSIEEQKKEIMKQYRLKKSQVSLFENQLKILEKAEDVAFWQDNLPKRVAYVEEKNLLADFIDTLYQNRVFEIESAEVLLLRRIFLASQKVFPLFAKLQKVEQVKILDKALTLSYMKVGGYRDIHVFAEAIFKVLADNNLHNVICIKNTTYYKVKDFTNSRFSHNPLDLTINMIQYEYYTPLNHTKLTTCLTPSEIWHRLTNANIFVA